MATTEVIEIIKRVVRNELDDCERAIKADDKQKALREIDGAIMKLNRVVRTLEAGVR